MLLMLYGGVNFNGGNSSRAFDEESVKSYQGSSSENYVAQSGQTIILLNALYKF